MSERGGGEGGGGVINWIEIEIWQIKCNNSNTGVAVVLILPRGNISRVFYKKVPNLHRQYYNILHSCCLIIIGKMFNSI